MTNGLLESDTTALALQASAETIVAWDDTKKTAFIATFSDRVPRSLRRATSR